MITIPLILCVVASVVLVFKFRPSLDLKVIWPVFLFYGLHMLGMAWTTDLAFGLFDLQVKIGLVLLPIAAAVLFTLVPELLHRSMVAFTLGTLVAIVLGFWKAWECYGIDAATSCFSQSTLSYEVHPSYAAWYCCWIVAYWGQRLVNRDITGGGMRKAIVIALSVMLAFILMLASKSGVIGAALVMAYLLVVTLIRFRGRERWAILAIALGVITLVLWSHGGLVRARMVLAWDAVAAFQKAPTEINDSAEGSALRMAAWTCSMDRLQSEPFGAGTGDIKHALMKCYVAKGATEAASRNLNSHGQFLQSAVALGWPGLVSILLLVLVPLWLSWRTRSPMLAAFMVLFMVNAVVESVLEVQAGVVFFSLFLGLLIQTRSSHSAVDPTERPVHR